MTCLLIGPRVDNHNGVDNHADLSDRSLGNRRGFLLCTRRSNMDYRDWPVTIHTDLTYDVLAALTRGLPGGAARGYSAIGVYDDCFYGWGESRFSPDQREEAADREGVPVEVIKCLPHSMFLTDGENALRVIRAITDDEYESTQFVVTETLEWANVIPDMPMNYDHNHTH